MLFVISGPSGVGKSTVLRRLVREVPNLAFAVSHTTRPRRQGEGDGRDYHFVSGDAFDRLVRERAFVEWAVVHGHRYGTSREALRAGGGDDLLIEVDVQGADALRAQMPEAVTIFITPPRFEDLETRIEGRGRETEAELRKRLETARSELRRADAYDHQIVNDDLAGTVRALAALIRRARATGLTMRMRSPFRPGAGERPPLLAGRGAELALATEKIHALGAGDPPSKGLLFFGPRGNGKTVLLAQIAEDARGLGLRAERLPAAAFATRQTLVRQLQENAGLTAARLRGAQAAGFSVTTDPASPTESVEELLVQWIRAEESPLVVLLDEAHTVEPEAGRVFFDAVQEADARSLPFLLLAAGTPDAPRRLRRAGTFTERALERVPVGRLAPPATLRALTQPARDAGRPLSEGAAALLAAESQHYPYFIQLLGNAAWKAAGAEEGEITAESARAGVEAARPRIERFYAERFDEASDRKVDPVLIPLARLLAERGGQLGELAFGAFRWSLTDWTLAPGTSDQIVDTLTDLGILWQDSAGRWEMGIPSFADYLLRLDAADAAEAADGD